MTAWQPIATAPKDGTRILLWLCFRYRNQEPRVEIAKWHQPANKMVAGFWATPIRGEPTHWMPLPEPPGRDGGDK